MPDGTISLGIMAGAGAARPPSGGAIVDIDAVHRRYIHAGRLYADEAAFLSAIGGVANGSRRTFGPFVSSAELLTNGDFATGDLTGWTVGQNGGGPATGAVVSGEGHLFGNSANVPALYQNFTAAAGHAYRFTGRYRRVTSGNGPSLQIALASAGVLNSSDDTAPNNTTSFVSATRTFGCIGTGTPAISVGLRNVANPATSIAAIDDASLEEVIPFEGFVPNSFSLLIEATTPAATDGTQVIWQIDDAKTYAQNMGGGVYQDTPQERNYVRFCWGADRHLHLLVVSETTRDTVVTQADLDLGTIAVSTSFRLAASLKPNAIIASLDGRPAVSDTSAVLPGVAVMRIGCSQLSGTNDFDGTTSRLVVWATSRTAEDVENLAAGDARDLLAAWGDSLTGSNGASDNSHSWLSLLATARGKAAANEGIGGQTSTQIAARTNAVPIVIAVTGNVIPASGAVAVTAKNVNVLYAAGSYTGTIDGTLCGVHGTMSTDGTGNWTFTRTTAGSSVPCPSGSAFVTDVGVTLRRRTALIWAGRNNYAQMSTIEADVSSVVASLGHPRSLVLSVLNGSSEGTGTTAYTDIAAINAALSAAFGSRFVDVRAALVAAGDPVTDAADIAADIVPTSLRSDNIHLNDAGYAVIAATVGSALTSLGW